MRRRPDSYHTCYNLCGLSIVEHSHTYGQANNSEPFASAFTWEAGKTRIPSESDHAAEFDTGAEVRPLHPVYVIPHKSVRDMRAWAVARPLGR